MSKKFFLVLAGCLLLQIFLTAQTTTLSGTIRDQDSQEPLIGATVKVGNMGAVTDFDGFYTLKVPKGNYDMEVRFVCYHPQTIKMDLSEKDAYTLDFSLEQDVSLLQMATVTSGKYEQALGEATVSLEVLRTQLLESVNATSIDEALNKISGVDIIDGQVNIRGGSGFSYGAGSRVLVLMDDIPILQADAGLPQWDDIPVENIDQIEVIKGAASALYGSSALNGIINVRTAYAKSQPETKISTFYTYYDDFKEKEQIWYTQQPRTFGGSVSHKRKIDKVDLVFGAYYLDRESFNRSTYNRYWRSNLGLRYRKSDKLVFGFNSNFNPGESGNFFFWKGLDSLFVGSDNSLSTTERLRFTIDPYLNYFDPAGNKHRFIGRFFYVDNQNNNDQSNTSRNWYGEYQFQRKWAGLGIVTTAGLVYQGNFVDAPLYGNVTFTNRNLAGYLQAEKKVLDDRLNLTRGFRYEHYKVTTPDTVTNAVGFRYPIENGEIIESKPVVRLGANLKVGRLTYLRTSWGQGYRFPTIAESFIQTMFGGVFVFPNPELQSETGWSAEMGIKQGFQVSNFDGFLDIAAFWSQYADMIEFNFAPDPRLPLGFQSINVGDTDIKGFECTVAGRGEFFGLPTTILTGYTFLDPRFQQFDSTPVEAGGVPNEGQRNYLTSSSRENILKYRSRHTAKLDIQTTYANFSIGFAVNYNSFIEAVDGVFETLIVPGLKQYRADNNHGNTIYGARVAYQFWNDLAKVSVIVNNLTNEMYSIRPGLMEAPRNFTARLDWNF